MSLLAYCGISCETCPVYRATVADSHDLRVKAAKEWSEMLNVELKPEQMVCFGCKSDILFYMCAECDIRYCNLERELNHCGECPEYSCEQIERFLAHMPEEKAELDKLAAKIRESRQQQED